MKQLLLKNNKKALSEIVGYTILIVIAISMSILVYSFLRLYIPKEKVTCEEDVRLIIQGHHCENGMLNITITNKGLFKADAIYLRFGEESQTIKTQINNESFLLYSQTNSPGLNPGESSDSRYNVSGLLGDTSNYGLELQPAIIRNKQIIVCENAIITQPIKCIEAQ